MIFLDNLKACLGYEIGIYDLKGKLIKGKNIGFKSTDDVLIRSKSTYILCQNHIVAISSELSEDACRLIKSTYDLLNKNNTLERDSLEYIIKNDVPPESIRGKYINYRALYITSRENILDIVKNIYEDESVEFVIDNEGIYLVKLFEDPREEAEAIIEGIRQEGGLKAIIGCSRAVGREYTIKDASRHARAACEIAGNLNFTEGFFSIEGMLVYGLINSLEDEDIQFYLQGGYEGFSLAARDRELVDTAEQLFKCNLNISEASRNLYIHRNTLLYRIEKIKNLTGLDIKSFEDALTFKIIITVLKLKNNSI